MADGGEVSGQKKNTRINCSSCLRKQQFKVALTFCAKCEAFFCTECTEQHNSLLGNHPMQDIQGEDLRTVSEIPKEMCPDHVKIMDLFCKEHDKLGCSTCMFLEHRTCDPVLYIPTSIEELFQSADINHLKSQITETMKRLEAITLRQSITKSDLDEQRINCLDGIDSHHSNLRALLDNIVEKSKTKVVQKYDTMTAELKRHSQEVETSLADLKAAEGRLDVSNGNRAQQFIEYKKCQNIIQATDQISKDANVNVRLEGFAVSIDKQLEDLLTNLDTLVSVIEPFKVRKTHRIDVSVVADKCPCYIEGTCVLTDGSVLLIDRWNNRLKRLESTSLSVTDHCLMEKVPSDVCYINVNEVVVAQGRCLVFVALLPRLKPTRTLTLNHNCWYVAYSDNDLFVTDWDKSLYVYNMSGDLLRTVTTDDSGQNIFSSTRHVAVSEDGEKVFIVHEGKGLVTVDRHGRVLGTLTHSDVSGTRGVCPDGSGGLLLCGCSSHNVVHVSRRGNDPSICDL